MLKSSHLVLAISIFQLQENVLYRAHYHGKFTSKVFTQKNGVLFSGYTESADSTSKFTQCDYIPADAAFYTLDQVNEITSQTQAGVLPDLPSENVTLTNIQPDIIYADSYGELFYRKINTLYTLPNDKEKDLKGAKVVRIHDYSTKVCKEMNIDQSFTFRAVAHVQY